MPKTYARHQRTGQHEYDHATGWKSFPWINQPEPIAPALKEQTTLKMLTVLSRLRAA